MIIYCHIITIVLELMNGSAKHKGNSKLFCNVNKYVINTSVIVF